MASLAEKKSTPRARNSSSASTRCRTLRANLSNFVDGRRDDHQWEAIARQFRSRAAAVRTLARIVAASFEIDENQLPVPAEDADVILAAGTKQ
jgi:hypothetical protein